MLRLGLVATLVLLLVAACGGSAAPPPAALPKLPADLASHWEDTAGQIATVAATDPCHARDLAVSLQNDVSGHLAEVPARLRSPLQAGVSSLVTRLVCEKHHGPPPGKGPKDHKPGHDHAKGEG